MKKLSIATAAILLSTPVSALTMFDDVDLYETSSMYHTLQGNGGIAVAKGSCCTGALIDPYWVITANHVSSSRWSVTKYKEEPEGIFNIVAQQKALLDLDNDPWGQAKFVIKDRNGENVDLAMFKLNQPFTAIEPAKIYNFDEFGYDLGGRLGLVANRSGRFQIMGTFTHRTDKDYSQYDKVAWIDQDISGVPRTQFETQVRAGDSGSGLYVEREGEIYLAGLTSYRWASGSKRGQAGYSAAFYRKQIMQIMKDNAYIKTATYHEWKADTDMLESPYTYAPVVEDSFSNAYSAEVGATYRVSFDVNAMSTYDIEVEGRTISYDRVQNEEVIYTELTALDGELNIKVTNKGQEPIHFNTIAIHKL